MAMSRTVKRWGTEAHWGGAHFQFVTSKLYHFQIVPLPNYTTSKLQIAPLPNCITSKLYHFQIVSLLNLLTVVIRGLIRVGLSELAAHAQFPHPVLLHESLCSSSGEWSDCLLGAVGLQAMASPLSSHSDSEEPCISRDQGMFCIA